MNFKALNRIFDMANLPPKRTGLPFQIWYSAEVPKHKPRIKVDLSDGSQLSVEIESHKIKGDSSKVKSSDLKKLFKWLDLNKEILLDYWFNAHSGSIDNVDVFESLKKI